jgi:pimeloyl-ACP methyl ester carboxylesterase
VNSKYFFRIIIFALVALLLGALWWVPVASEFIHYLVWRLTTKTVVFSGYVRVKDGDIHFASYGSGPAVLLLHGGLSNRLSWFSQLPWLVETGRRVVLPDTRGHGRSSLGRRELTYRLLAADAIAVLDKLGIAQTDIVGWSDGGNTALMVGLYWPQRVDRMVVISANSSPAGLAPEARRETLESSRGATYWFRRWWTGAGKRFQVLEKRIKRMWRQRPNLQLSDLERITASTLVIVGSKDIVSITHARQMAKELANGSLDIIPGGHFTPVTQARRVNNLIADFFGIGTSPVKTRGGTVR